MKRLLITLVLLSCSWHLHAWKKFDVFYLCIGSEHYEQNPARFKEPGFRPYDRLPEARNSAVLVAGILEKYADAKGKTCLSDQNNKITKSFILKQIALLLSQIKESKAQSPLLVFYYCGHGISENLAWNQFLIPGDYTFIPGTKHFDHLASALIGLGDITDKLDKGKIPYLVIADCCRKQETDNSLPEKRLQYFFNEQNVETFKTLVGGLKYLNEYHQANPVIFSIEPGKSAPVVDLPPNTPIPGLDTAVAIGPVSRRLLIAALLYPVLTKEQLLTALTDSSIDKGFPVPVSFYEADQDANKQTQLLQR